MSERVTLTDFEIRKKNDNLTSSNRGQYSCKKSVFQNSSVLMQSILVFAAVESLTSSFLSEEL